MSEAKQNYPYNHFILDLIGESPFMFQDLHRVGFEATVCCFKDVDVCPPEVMQHIEDGDYNTVVDLGWVPDPPEGEELLAAYDTEDGPVALFVKPKTALARAMLEAGRRPPICAAAPLLLEACRAALNVLRNNPTAEVMPVSYTCAPGNDHLFPAAAPAVRLPWKDAERMLEAAIAAAEGTDHA